MKIIKSVIQEVAPFKEGCKPAFHEKRDGVVLNETPNDKVKVARNYWRLNRALLALEYLWGGPDDTNFEDMNQRK